MVHLVNKKDNAAMKKAERIGMFRGVEVLKKGKQKKKKQKVKQQKKISKAEREKIIKEAKEDIERQDAETSVIR